MAERLAASLLPAASPSPSARRAKVGAAAAAPFPSSCPGRAGLRLRSSRRPARFSKAAAGRGGGGGGALRVVRCMAASDAAQLKSAREDIRELLKTTYCHPIMVSYTVFYTVNQFFSSELHCLLQSMCLCSI